MAESIEERRRLAELAKRKLAQWWLWPLCAGGVVVLPALFGFRAAEDLLIFAFAALGMLSAGMYRLYSWHLVSERNATRTTSQHD